MALGDSWGASAAERAARYPCDDLCRQAADAAYHRAVTVRAPASHVFRWLCQLKAAPYSYDWIDNRGRRSPAALLPGLERLEVGQTVMTIFDLAAFEPGRSLTLVNKPRGGARRVFGEVWVSYVAEEAGEAETRLLAKLLVRYPPGAWGRLVRVLLPAGDLLMMRRQLLNLRRLAERFRADGPTGPRPR